MASAIYAFWSITNVASMHCSVRPEISPCTCEPYYASNNVELSCEKVDSFHQIVNALSNKFEQSVNISLKISYSHLEDLEMLSFRDMNLTLVKLRLQWNYLKSIPELPFRGLSNVEYLSVGDNELDEIPKHMLNHLPIVKTLDMGRCRIRVVQQDDFKGTQMLNNLFLPSNNITRIDKGAFPPNLIILHLGRNYIESLNGTLRNLDKLESLFLNSNNITKLEDELPESNNLKLIIARNNQLRNLPESMRYLDKLESLQIQNNYIRTLDGILRNKRKLNQFNAQGNQIEYLAKDEFQSCETLEEFDMAFNKLKSLNNSLLPMKKLHNANFSFNEIIEFSMNEIRGLMYLRDFDLSNNVIEKLTGRQENNVDQNSYLLQFNLDHNKLKSLDGALMGLNSLRILSLSYNQIERILPEDFIGLVKLEILDISHNQLLTLKEMETTYLQNLKILKVAYNNLTKLEKDFHGLPVLCQANLTNNQITTISSELVAKTNCTYHNVSAKLDLYIEDNPIMCDERLVELCLIMEVQETRIRGKSQCFETDPEVCVALQLQFPDFVKQQQSYPYVIPKLLIAKQLQTPIVYTLSATATTPSTTTSTTTTTTTTTTVMPIIIELDYRNTTTTTTTQWSNAILPLNTTTPTSLTINPTTTTMPDTTTATTMSMPITVIYEPNTTIATAISMSIPTTTISPNTTSTTITTTAANAESTTSPAPVLKLSSTTSKPTYLAAELPPVVFDIDEGPVMPISPLNPKKTTTNDEHFASLTPLSQGEYPTVEYIANMDEFIPENHQSTHVHEEDSNANSVHEEFPSVVLAALDTAQQSLLIPEEPPENNP